jgi:hypothetical protein
MDAHFEDEFMNAADDTLINDLYATYLDELLTTKEVKQSKLREYSIKFKRSTLLKHKREKAQTWGEKEDSILNAIRQPDVEFGELVDLERVLVGANKVILQEFINYGGVKALLNILDAKIAKTTVASELDIGIVIETLHCLKEVIKHTIGLENFISIIGSIKKVALSLIWEYKPLAILVCCSIQLNLYTLFIGFSLGSRYSYALLAFLCGFKRKGC